MLTSGSRKISRIAALCSAVLLLPASAVTQEQTKQGEKAIEARQGFMQVVSWEAGPLFGMAKGDIAYDAEAAAANAENLNAVVQYSVDRLFIQGTSKANYTGKTRALADIWEEPQAFEAAFRDLQEAVAVVAREAGDGRDALTAAVSEMGNACGDCHDEFRADEF